MYSVLLSPEDASASIVRHITRKTRAGVNECRIILVSACLSLCRNDVDSAGTIFYGVEKGARRLQKLFNTLGLEEQGPDKVSEIGCLSVRFC